MASMSADALLALAAVQLGVPSSLVPKSYTEELKKHLVLNRYDTEFKLVPQKGNGFGVVICLEKGCEGVQVPLTARADGDGGKKDGFGSLAAYRLHASQHPTHKLQRLQRIKGASKRSRTSSANSLSPAQATQATQATTSGSKLRGGLVNALSSSGPSAPATAASRAVVPLKMESADILLSSLNRPSPSSQVPKPEPVESTIPRKRLSDSYPNSSPKKTKIEEARAPLAPVELPTNTARVPSTVAPTTGTPPPATYVPAPGALPLSTAERQRVAYYDVLIQNARNAIALITRKKRKSQADQRNLAAYRRNIPSWENARRALLSTAVPSTAPTAAVPYGSQQPAGPSTATIAPAAQPLSATARQRIVQLDYLIKHGRDMISVTMRKKRKSQADKSNLARYQRDVPTWESERRTLASSATILAASAVVPGSGPAPTAHYPPVPALPQPEAAGGFPSGTQQPAGPSTSNALQVPHKAIALPSKPSISSAADLNPETSLRGIGALVHGTDYTTTDDDDDDEGIRLPDFDMSYPNLTGAPDLFRYPKSSPDDIDFFLKAAGNAVFDESASVQDSLKILNLKDTSDKVPGLDITLMAHQLIGVSWMVEKERGFLKGGCMCDDMGLGKTVQMIATSVINRSDDPGVKTTLIVAPLALLDQWKLEIETKTTLGLTCFIYHGSNKPKKKIDLQRYDYVMTTYQTLAMEWPDPEEQLRKKSKKKITDDFIDSDGSDSDAKSKKKKKKAEPGLLMRFKWYRVVLDEAQNIRNKRTRVSRAVTDLDATYRWCLTGTPIINSLADAYGLIRFLRVRPWHDWEEYNSRVARLEKKNASLASERLQGIFSTMLLRRRKDTMLDGKPLIELPKKEIFMNKLTFTQEEREIYTAIEARAQAQFNRFLRAGTVLKNYAQVLVMLLRLRQICAHPCLIAEDSFTAALIGPNEANELEIAPGTKKETLSNARVRVGSAFVESVKKKMLDIVVARIEAEKKSMDATVEEDDCPVCYDTFTEPVVTACQHTFCRECAQNVLNTAHVDDASEPNRYKAAERPCPSCRAPISAPILFPREAFMPTDAEINAVTGYDVKMEDVEEEDVKPAITKRESGKAEDSDEEMPDVSALIKSTKGKGKAKAQPKTRTLPARKKRAARMVLDSEDEGDDDDDEDMSDFIVQEDEDEDEKDLRRAEKNRRLRKRRGSTPTSPEASEAEESDSERTWGNGIIFGATKTPVNAEEIKLMPRFLPSTKMKHMMSLLEQWEVSHPDEKVLVISQWTQCLELVSDYLREKGIGHVKYQGDMNRQQRDLAVRAFMARNKARVMLMSLKCGGVGLNLTRGNRVISLDLAWSEAVESQAFDRVHRLGQNREVEVHRLVIADTVEDRVLDLQIRKRALADGSLGEGTGKKQGRLSVRDLARLLGFAAGS